MRALDPESGGNATPLLNRFGGGVGYQGFAALRAGGGGSAGGKRGSLSREGGGKAQKLEPKRRSQGLRRQKGGACFPPGEAGLGELDMRGGGALLPGTEKT